MSSTIRTPWPRPVGAAPLERLEDRRQPEGLAGVDREAEALPLDVLEGVEVAGRRVPLLGAGDVEADDAGVAPAHGELGDLERAGGGAHGGDQRPDGEAGALRAEPEALERGLDHLVEREPRSTLSSGAKRTSAYTTPSSARSRAHSAATRVMASRSCMTPTVCWKVSR
jgi:hypothetical protein